MANNHPGARLFPAEQRQVMGGESLGSTLGYVVTLCPECCDLTPSPFLCFYLGPLEDSSIGISGELTNYYFSMEGSLDERHEDKSKVQLYQYHFLVASSLLLVMWEWSYCVLWCILQNRTKTIWKLYFQDQVPILLCTLYAVDWLAFVSHLSLSIGCPLCLIFPY